MAKAHGHGGRTSNDGYGLGRGSHGMRTPPLEELLPIEAVEVVPLSLVVKHVGSTMGVAMLVVVKQAGVVILGFNVLPLRFWMTLPLLSQLADPPQCTSNSSISHYIISRNSISHNRQQPRGRYY